MTLNKRTWDVQHPLASLDQEQCQWWMLFLGILSWNGQMTLKITVDDLQCLISVESQDAYLVILTQSITSYCADKPNFLESWVKMAKITWKVIANDPHFQYQSGVSHNVCLVQIWWFQLKSVTSYRVDKAKFMDGRTDRQMDSVMVRYHNFIKIEMFSFKGMPEWRHLKKTLIVCCATLLTHWGINKKVNVSHCNTNQGSKK